MKLPDVLKNALQIKQVYDKSGETIPLSSNVSLQEATELYQAVHFLKPSVSAEVGLAHGISTMAILQALQDNQKGVHHVMDPHQASYAYSGPTMIQKANLSSRFRFYEKFAEEVFPSLPPLQFVFIDASHLFDLTLTEFVLADKKLETNGLIAFHDMWMPSLQKVIRYILANRSYELWKLPGEKTPSYNHPRWKRIIVSLARSLSASRRFFRPEFLNPWSTLSISNLVILRKTSEDKRDWRFHNEF